MSRRVSVRQDFVPGRLQDLLWVSRGKIPETFELSVRTGPGQSPLTEEYAVRYEVPPTTITKGKKINILSPRRHIGTMYCIKVTGIHNGLYHHAIFRFEPGQDYKEEFKEYTGQNPPSLQRILFLVKRASYSSLQQMNASNETRTTRDIKARGVLKPSDNL